MQIDNDTNFNYYHEYCRLYLANVVLRSQMSFQLNLSSQKKKERRSKMGKKMMKIERKDLEEQPIKFRGIIDVLSKYANDHMDLRDHLTNIQNQNTLRFTNSQTSVDPQSNHQ